MTYLPEGVVTFLFTDIEGSTRLWELFPEVMPAALARHDEIMSQAIGAQAGVVFRTVGDAFFAAFGKAPAAFAAALAAQRALYSEPWGVIETMRVRMALHTSAVDIRDGNYSGPPLNRVARLLVAGHGGQTLLCHTTAALLREQLPAGVTLRDMGEHRLRDLIEPEQIFQLLAEGLPAEFPPLKTITTQAATAAAAAALPPAEAYITRQHRLPGMPEIDFDGVIKKERERQRKTRKGKAKEGGQLF